MDNLIALPNPDDPLDLRPIDSTLVEQVASVACTVPRRRHILRFHNLDELVQRMVNALEPESYVRPHQHHEPDKVEVFICLRGKAMVVRFDEDGKILRGLIISANGPTWGVEVPPTAWHTVLAVESGTVMFEIKEGPYDATADKHFAPWSPSESDTAAGLVYLQDLRHRLGLSSLE